MNEAATHGVIPDGLVEPRLERSHPRLYDEATDFADLEGFFGAYLIYATRCPPGMDLGPSRLQYIGRWMDLWHGDW